jgi:tetratricopeptide (TPR) repeat protein
MVFDASAQCETWVNSPQVDDLKNAHSIYRQALKINDFNIAFENWKKAFEGAPAADGKRDYHYIDGAALYKNKFESATDEAQKKEFAQKAIDLYDQAIACYESRGIILPCNTDKCYREKVSFVEGRKAYDMFYTYRTPYDQIGIALENSVEKGGNKTEYIVMAPYTEVVIYQFTNNKMDAPTARAIYDKLNAITDYNIKNNKKLGVYYQQAKDAMNGRFAYIERQIFDCEYFKEKLRPDYEADPENPEVIKSTIAILKGQGCEPGDPFYDELDAKYKKYVDEENARRVAEFKANNPAFVARDLYDQGKFDESISKYREAMNEEEDPAKKGEMLFAIASIQFRKLDRYSDARKTALEAASMKEGWGRPYMLIGDMYGSSARSCGDSWNQRLAILAAIDKYSYAKSIDSEVAEEAQDRISKYYGSMPSQDEGFMRGIKAGQTLKVGCWIGETVRIRYN